MVLSPVSPAVESILPLVDMPSSGIPAATTKNDGTIVLAYQDVLEYGGTNVSRSSKLVRDVARVQLAKRKEYKSSMCAGAASGAVISIIPSVLAGPFCPLVIVGAAAVGVAVGAALPSKQSASFQQVRKHLFAKAGIMSRRESSSVVKALKKAKVIDKGRGRNLISVADIDTVLAKKTFLKPSQREAVHESLSFIHDQAPHFDALRSEKYRLRNAIAAAKQGGDARDLGVLYDRQTQVLARLKARPGGPSAPQHVRLLDSV